MAGPLGRLVFNEAPGAPGPALGAAAGEALQRAMLAALAAHTTPEGRVDYERLRGSAAFAEARARADALTRVEAGALAGRADRLAFWINVYNALALHAVIALGVRRSVWQVWHFFGRVSYRIGPHVLSLDEIEHGLLRGNRRRAFPPWRPFRAGDPRGVLAVEPVDPRIHFAITCAARSCPPVGVYRPAEVDQQLTLAARNFVNQEVGLDDRGRIACSRLFKWYRGDFGSPAGLRAFLQAHLDDGPVRRALDAGAVPCQVFRRYSWALQHPPVE